MNRMKLKKKNHRKNKPKKQPKPPKLQKSSKKHSKKNKTKILSDTIKTENTKIDSEVRSMYSRPSIKKMESKNNPNILKNL